MNTFIGTVGDTDYYVTTILPFWSWRALLIKVTKYDHIDDLVQVEDLGKVRDHDQAVDKALVIVERKRTLLQSISRSMSVIRADKADIAKTVTTAIRDARASGSIR